MVKSKTWYIHMVVKPKAPYTIPPPTMAGTPKKIKIPNRLLISMFEFLSNCNCLIPAPTDQGEPGLGSNT